MNWLATYLESELDIYMELSVKIIPPTAVLQTNKNDYNIQTQKLKFFEASFLFCVSDKIKNIIQ